jgi:hypothetical protein
LTVGTGRVCGHGRVRHEIEIEAAEEQVWNAVRDVVAVHRRLVPGLAFSARLEGDFRILTLPDGHFVRAHRRYR